MIDCLKGLLLGPSLPKVVKLAMEERTSLTSLSIVAPSLALRTGKHLKNIVSRRFFGRQPAHAKWTAGCG